MTGYFVVLYGLCVDSVCGIYGVMQYSYGPRGTSYASGDRYRRLLNPLLWYKENRSFALPQLFY